MREALETLVLNPASALTAAVAYGMMLRSGATFGSLLNPWGLSLPLWVAGYLAVRMALLGFVDGFVWALAPRLPALPSRVGPKPVFQHKINATDVAYLIVNSTVEYVFALQISHLLWFAPLVVRAPTSLSLLNGPLAFWRAPLDCRKTRWSANRLGPAREGAFAGVESRPLFRRRRMLLVVDDMLYAPLHRAMHLQAVYRWVHKHHHRNTFPARGYIDAANEHPVEQIAALCLHWVAVHVVAHTAGLHVAAVLAHFGVKALGACFNHTGYDVQLRFCGIEYSVRAHETHHRKPNTNFAQYVMFWDKLMGTYKEYESGVKASAAAAATPANLSKPDAARLPAWADPAVEAREGRVTERPQPRAG